MTEAEFRYWLEHDWTRGVQGGSNNSPEFIALVDAVERLLREHVHYGGSPREVALLIMAQLAHKHHLAPMPLPDGLTEP